MSESTTGTVPVARFQLRSLGGAARLGVACVVLVLLGGLAASGTHVYQFHGPKDDVPGLSLDDLMGAYHGVQAPARLASALERGHPETLAPEARESLLTWLEGPRDQSGTRTGGKRIAEDFDSLDLGDMAPNEIISRSCLSCHSKKVVDANPIARTVPLDTREEALRLALPKKLSPPSMQILVTSTHTHALGLGSVAVATIALGLATGWPRRFVGVLCVLLGAGLLVDLGGQWVARVSPAGVYMLIVGGSAFALASVLMLLSVLVDLCLPRRS